MYEEVRTQLEMADEQLKERQAQREQINSFLDMLKQNDSAQVDFNEKL